jgi:anaerobic magnesium-protoporphyrin IX monomethyl ester cyclase
MADLTLINLNLLYLRHMDGVEQERHVPLGPLYLCAALEQAGLEVDFRDYQLHESEDPFSAEAIASFCADPAPIIGLSCMANLLPFTVVAAQELKRRFPDRLIVLGGVGAKSVEQRLLEAFPWIDVVAHGECERTIVELVQAHKAGASLEGIRGLCVRTAGGDGQVVMAPPQERYTDLGALPKPAYHLIDLPAYDGYGMVTSRGCPYPCTFCSVAPVWNFESYSRPFDDLIDEMRLLNERAGVRLFLFQDEFFVSSKRHVVGFCDALARSGLDVRWKAFGRINLTDAETMDAMKAAGCVEIRYGIESGSDRVLKRTKKGFSAVQSSEVIGLAVERFPRVDAFFIWGFPFETMDDFYQTLFQMLAVRLLGARVLPSLLCHLPQTAIYEEYRGDPKFEFCPDVLPEYMLTGHEVCHPSGIEIDQGHAWIFDLVTAHPEIFPGFFHYDVEGNIRPKLEALREHGFYGRQSDEPGQQAQTDLLTRPGQ